VKIVILLSLTFTVHILQTAELSVATPATPPGTGQAVVARRCDGRHQFKPGGNHWSQQLL